MVSLELALCIFTITLFVARELDVCLFLFVCSLARRHSLTSSINTAVFE